MADIETDERLFDEAGEFIPGGVNSPARAFRAVGGYPVFIKRGKGAKIYSECGRAFMDYCMSWGALILGHACPQVTAALREAIRQGTSFGTATKGEVELARRVVEALPAIEQIRLTNSGTEAVMGAVRLARAYTKKDKIIKFAGAYHGHADYLLTGAGAGVPGDFIKHTLVLPYNDIAKAQETVKKYPGELAAIIVEPVMANCGVILPREGFLPALRALADNYNIVLIFDEVVSGFRIAYGGAQGYFAVKPDLTCLGKIIGGGLPAGAFGGRKEIMRLLAPGGPVYQAGTFSGNPVTVSAGMTVLDILKRDNPYPRLEERTEELCRGIKERAAARGIALKVNHLGSLFSLFFTAKDVSDFDSALTQDAGLFRKFFHSLLKDGVYLSPSGFEADFLSAAHTERDIDNTLRCVETALEEL